MAEFTFTSSDGKPFVIKGPEGLTRDQAEAIFKKQDSTGSLVGFKPGTVFLRHRRQPTVLQVLKVLYNKHKVVWQELLVVQEVLHHWDQLAQH